MAKSYSCEYKRPEQLKTYIQDNEFFFNNKNIFIQVYHSSIEIAEIYEIQTIFKKMLPQAVTVGIPIEEAVENGKTFKNKTKVIFTVFEHTSIELFTFPNTRKPNTSTIKSIFQSVIRQDLKAIISFSIGNSNLHNELASLFSRKQIPYLIGSPAPTDKAFFFTNDHVFNDGLFIVGLYSSTLNVQTYNNFNWNRIGKPLIVTETDENRILALNHENPLKVIQSIFGTYITNEIMQSKLRIPFFISNNGVDKLLFILQIDSNGTFHLNDRISQNAEVYITFTHIEKLIIDSMNKLRKLAEKQGEVIFLNTSALRKECYESYYSQELKNLQKIAPVYGFFTQFELTEGNQAGFEILNTSALILSETDLIQKKTSKISYTIKSDMRTQIFFGNLLASLNKETKNIVEKIIKIDDLDIDTGLPNRGKIRKILSEEIAFAKTETKKIATMFIDIDRFKMVNDSLGHAKGDQIIHLISERIKAVIRSTNITLGRFGGDKFSLIVTDLIDNQLIFALSKQLLHAVSEPIHFEGKEVFLSASIGVSYFPEHGQDANILLKNADTAMNEAKKQGGNQIVLFSNEMDDKIQYRFELENYLRRSIEKGELFIVYQPLVDLQSGMLIGSEALIRWNHPNLGLISPIEFIPIAEETGLIHDIGKWILSEACKQNQKWIEKGFGEIFISVNVSAKQFQHPTFLNNVKEALDESGLDAKYLHLELTESGMIMNLQQSVHMMKSIQKLGVQVSIDDFGTGYSSLSYLKNLPINNLKIDRSLINNVHLEEVDRSIVKAIITIGNGLSVKVVAEGVETKEQIYALQKMKCDYAQGFYFEKPVDANVFSKMLETSRQIL